MGLKFQLPTYVRSWNLNLIRGSLKSFPDDQWQHLSCCPGQKPLLVDLFIADLPVLERERSDHSCKMHPHRITDLSHCCLETIAPCTFGARILQCVNPVPLSSFSPVSAAGEVSAPGWVGHFKLVPPRTAPLLHLKQLPSALLEYLGGTLDTLGGTLEAAGARSSYISRCNAWPATLLGIPQRQQLP